MRAFIAADNGDAPRYRRDVLLCVRVRQMDRSARVLRSVYSGSRCTVSIANAGVHTATYSAPPSSGVL